MQSLNDLATLLANPPGNLVYILAVTFSIVSGLPAAINQLRISGSPQLRRLVFGLGLLLGLQLFLFLLGALAQQNIFLTSTLLPIFDRTVLLLSLIWIIWLWAFPESSRNGDAGSVLLSLLVLAGCLLGLVAYASTSPTPGSFNLSFQRFLWDLGGILIVLLGILILGVRRSENWGIGIAMLLLAMLGFVLDVSIQQTKGDYSGILRFFMLAAFPMLLLLPTRLYFKAPDQTPSEEKDRQEPGSGVSTKEPIYELQTPQERRERRRYSTDAKTLQSLLALASDVDVDKANKDIVRSIAQALLVDLCFILYIGEDKTSISIASGYDLIREENLDGIMINREVVPGLVSAVLRGRILRMPSKNTSADMKGLAGLLGLPNPGNLLNVPVVSEKGPLGSILLLSPYSNRSWTPQDQTFLTTIAASVVPILERLQRTGLMMHESEHAQSIAKDAADQTLGLKASNAELSGQINELKDQLQQAQAQVGFHKQMLEQASKAALVPIGIAQREGSPAAASNPQMENELATARAELARLENELSAVKREKNGLKTGDSAKGTSTQAEVIVSISQELRQPMSSIIGYADLLLGESVGILGALQRKFIERIRTSTERIGSLVDDLIQFTTLEAGLLTVKPKPVDLNIIIDNVMAYTSGQMREKNITLRIDIPDNLQPFIADHEALQQILIHLLQNAGGATPTDGSVTLRVRMQREKGVDSVLLQVSDTGGGIPEEDLPRVFSRLYRAENPLIEGVGDTGVGLSIAKSLTEAHHGSIWVETRMGIGSTFNVSLPLETYVSAANPQGA